MDNEAREQLRREDCRIQVRAYLYERGMKIAQRSDVIARTMRAQFDFSAEEVEAACLFLEGDGQLEAVQSGVGATKHFRITSKGILEHERSQV